MAEKKAILIDAAGMRLAGSGDALDKLNKKAAVLTDADVNGLAAKALALGGVKTDVASLAGTLENASLAVISGKEDALAAALETANRRTVVVVAADDGVAFYGMAINSKAGKGRPQGQC